MVELNIMNRQADRGVEYRREFLVWFKNGEYIVEKYVGVRQTRDYNACGMWYRIQINSFS